MEESKRAAFAHGRIINEPREHDHRSAWSEASAAVTSTRPDAEARLSSCFHLWRFGLVYSIMTLARSAIRALNAGARNRPQSARLTHWARFAPSSTAARPLARGLHSSAGTCSELDTMKLIYTLILLTVLRHGGIDRPAPGAGYVLTFMHDSDS